MIPYFKKFSIDVPKFNENFIFPLARRNLVNSDLTTHGVRYHDIQNSVLKLRLMKFFQILDPSNVSYVEIKDEEVIPPHRDHDDVITCINYYFQASDAKTLFFESIDENLRYALPGETQRQMYHFDNIIEKCSFTAEDHSFYVLNVSKIHSVLVEKTKVRKFFSWQFTNKTFDEVCELLEKNF